MLWLFWLWGLEDRVGWFVIVGFVVGRGWERDEENWRAVNKGEREL